MLLLLDVIIVIRDFLNSASGLCRNIAWWGQFEELMSNNRQDNKSEFKTFLKEYGTQHTTSSLLYPQSNRLEEKAVQTMKMVLNKCKEVGEGPYLALLDLRNIPRDQSIGSPAQRLMGRYTKILTSEPGLGSCSHACSQYERKKKGGGGRGNFHF